MEQQELARILHLRGIPFLKALLEIEEKRFSHSEFLKGSTFEEINISFGLFPAARAYPVYFAGDITQPIGKKIFVGINPGYSNSPRQIAEQKYLEQRGSFDGYCRIFSDFFALHEKGLLPYFANIGGFLRRYFDIHERIDWNWLQENVISLDLIPYHSQNAAGLQIRNPEVFRKSYFEIFLRILEHLDPREPIFFHGFPTVLKYLEQPAFRGAVDFQERHTFWVGAFNKKFKFIGLPFLTRVAGGKDALVAQIKRSKGAQRDH
jgi:hypothetical protein